MGKVFAQVMWLKQYAKWIMTAVIGISVTGICVSVYAGIKEPFVRENEVRILNMRVDYVEKKQNDYAPLSIINVILEKMAKADSVTRKQNELLEKIDKKLR